MKSPKLSKLIKKYSKSLTMLANSLSCPGCNKIVRAPFFNLGLKFNWAEGCQDCFKKHGG